MSKRGFQERLDSRKQEQIIAKEVIQRERELAEQEQERQHQELATQRAQAEVDEEIRNARAIEAFKLEYPDIYEALELFFMKFFAFPTRKGQADVIERSGFLNLTKVKERIFLPLIFGEENSDIVVKEESSDTTTESWEIRVDMGSYTRFFSDTDSWGHPVMNPKSPRRIIRSLCLRINEENSFLLILNEDERKRISSEGGYYPREKDRQEFVSQEDFLDYLADLFTSNTKRWG